MECRSTPRLSPTLDDARRRLRHPVGAWRARYRARLPVSGVGRRLASREPERRPADRLPSAPRPFPEWDGARLYADQNALWAGCRARGGRSNRGRRFVLKFYYFPLTVIARFILL